jgi:hypothetical protein
MLVLSAAVKDTPEGLLRLKTAAATGMARRSNKPIHLPALQYNVLKNKLQ